jgi:tetratricopeptide (TPR) repeat protein
MTKGFRDKGIQRKMSSAHVVMRSCGHACSEVVFGTLKKGILSVCLISNLDFNTVENYFRSYSEKMKVNFKHVYCPLILTILTLFHPSINAQKTITKADEETLKLINASDDQKGKETGALILLKDYLVTINEKGENKTVIRVLGKIYSQEALSDYSTIPIGYNSFYEEPTLDYARVIQKDGTITEVPKDAVQIKTTPESQGLHYTDSRYISFALSGLVTGDAFDYKITFNQKAPIIEGAWFDNHRFGALLLNLSPPYVPRIDPVITSRYTLIVPKGTKFQYHLYNGAIKPLIENNGNQDKYQWVFSDLRSVKIEEDMPDPILMNPVLIIGSLNSWSQVDQWAAGKILSKVETPPEVVSKAKELTSGKVSADQKIKAIAEFIQTNIRYVYADLERGGFTPHSVKEILNSKYGDCKDKSILLISLMKAIGLEAYPALIEPYPYPELTEIPSAWFSHMITYVPLNGKELWLDMTSEVTPYPELSASDQNRTAFVINGNGGKLIKTPASNIRDNLSNFQMTSAFKDRSVSISMKIDCIGLYSDMLKSIFKQVDANARTEAFKRLVTNYFENANIENVRISDLNSPETPFSVELIYHLDTIWKKEQGIFSWGSHSLLPLSIISDVNVQSLPEKRINDIVSPVPYMINGTEKYLPPQKNYLPVSIPANDSIKNDFFEFKQVFKKDGEAIIANWSYKNKGINIPVEKYPLYVSDIKSIKEKIKWNISFVDPMEFIFSFKEENPYKILTYSNKFLQEDPKNVLALMLRGVAYEKLKQDDEVVKAFQEALNLAPDNKYALLFITFSNKAKRNPVFVLSHLNQALGEDPVFEPALLERASFYTERNEYEKALTDLNKVLTQNPKSLRGYTLRGSVLFKMGKKLQSFASYEEALAIDSTNLSLCQYLAHSYLSIDTQKAIELLNRAIKMKPDDVATNGSMGWAWYLAGDDQKSLEYSKKAINIDQKVYFARYNLALATLRSGDISEAKKLYGELKKEATNITAGEIEDARKDLNDLKAKGKYVNEIISILKDFF